MGLYDKYDPFSGVDVDTDQLHRQLTAMETSIAARPEPIASRSTLGEMGAGFKRGLFVAVPEMAGGAIKSIAGVDSDWYKKGQDLQESAQAIAKLPEFQKSTTADDGLVNKVLVSGAEGVGQMAPIIATGALNPYAGAALAAGMYGGSTYQDTKERMLKQEGLDDRFAADNPDDPRVVKAKNTGLATGATQGLGEGAMSLVGGKFVKAALPTIGKATVESILGKTAKPGLAALKEYAKGMGLELAGETITEPLQDETQAAIERSAGLKDAPRFMEQAAGSAQGGFGTALLLAPFGIPAHVAKYSRSAAVQSALTDPAADPAARVAAAQLVAQDLQKVDPDAATNFLDHAVDAIGDEATTGSAPYALDLSDSALLLPKQSATVADNAQQVSALPGQQTDTTTGTAGASPAPGGADAMGDIPEFGSPAIARDGAVPPIAGGNQYQQFADAPFTNATAQPAIAGPAVEGMLGNLKPVAADGSKNSLASALLAGGNPYQRFADTPFVNAPVQPAIAGAGVEGMLGVLQPAPSSPRYQAMQWAEQQMQDPATSKFERQNLNALIKAADPEKKDLVKYWASSTGQRKQPVATIAGVPTQQQGVAVNDSQSGKTTQVVMPGEFGQPASQAPTAVVSQPLTSNPVLSQKTGNMNVKRDRSVKPASDDMITAIAKLGGLNQDQAIAQWGNAIKDSKKDLARHATKNGKAGFLHVISKTGKNLDEMREALEEQGYLQPGSSIEDMYARIDQHLGGRPTYSNQNQQQVEDQDLSQAPDGVDESDYPFDLSGINFPEKERKRLKFLKQMLNNARNEKTKAQAKKALQRFMIDQSANQAATSPQNNLSEPTQAQIEAGNYKKGHVLLHGLDISIENPAGSLRKGVDESGKQWQTKIAHHYGYIKGTIGKDKDHIDIFIGPQQDSRKLFVVDQKNIKTGAFDEHKVMAGFNSLEEARAGYLANYDKTGPDRIGAITETTVDQFKQWLKDGNTKQQFSKDVPGSTLAHDGKTADSAAPRKSQPDADQQYLDDVSKRFEEKFKSAIFEIDEDQQKQRLKEGYYVIDRIPQEAERAVLTGKLGAAASIAGRSSGTDIADAGQGKTAGEAAYQVKQNQAKALTAWAKEHDLLIDAAEFNRQWSVDKIQGAEHDVYFTNDNRVIKRLTPTFTTWSDYFNRVALHNYLFPDTAYDLKGFMLDNGKLFAVVEQPFIKQHESQLVTDADIFADTEQMGFTHKPSKGMTGDEARAQDFYHADGIVMTDLHDANVFRNYAGSLRYIDAIIWMDYATKHQRLAERYGLSDKAGLDIEIDVDLPTTRNTAKHKAFLQRMLKNAKDEKSRARIQKGLEKLEARTKPTAPTPATSGPSTTSENNEQSGPVPMLLGEKIGGARKDLESSGTPSKPKKPVSNVPAWKRRYLVSEVANRDSKHFGKWLILDTTTSRPLVRKYFDSAKEAEQFLPLAVFAVKHRVQLDSDGTWKIVRNVTDRKRVTLKDGFASEEEANRYAIEHAIELIEQNTYFGEEIIARPETVRREGPQHRDGNATATMFMDTFGFRSAEFGNWNNEAERQEILNHAFDSLMDMADILNIPPKAVSLNGELAIAFGARGQGLSGAAAHYEPGYAVINLTKMAGAGHLFHEWLHAMDNYFARQDGRAKSEKEPNKRGDLVYPAKKEDMVSDGFSRKGSGVRQEVQDAFLNLMETIWYKTEQYVEDTEKAQRFVQSALDNVSNQLADIRRNIATERRYGAKKKPATAEQLQQFDVLADKLKDPAGASVEWRHGIGLDPKQPVKRGNMGQNRWTNDTLEELSTLVKAVTGRSGFNAEGHGEMNYLASRVRDLHNRNSMLQEARNRDTKTKKVPTAYRQEAYKIDQGRSSDYWTEKWEMLARAGSAYMEDQLKNNDRRNDFLSFGSDNKYYRLFNIRPFPEGQERESINAAFDNLFATLKTKETDKGVALYSATEETGSLFTSGLESDTITEKKISQIKGITPVSAVVLRGKGLQPVEVQGETSDMLRAVAGRFGLKAIFYRAQELDAARDGGKQTAADRSHSADGFITGADKKTIFLNVNSGRHLQFILGHEISHALDLNNEKAYQQLLVDIFPYLNKEKVVEYEDYLKTNPIYKNIDTFGTYKEVVADALGELFVSKNAWSTIAAEKPGLFSRLADAVVRVLDKIKSLFTNELKPATFFTDYAKVNRILLNAIKEYAKNNGGTDGLTDTTKEYYAAAGNYLPERPFYSAAFKLVSDAKQTRWGSVQDLLNWLKGKVTQDEINQLGLAELEGKPTKQEVLDQIAANSVEFKDVVLGISKSFNRDAEEERMKQELFDEAMEYDFGDGNWWYEPISSRKSELLDEIKATEKKVDPADEDNEAYEFTYNGKTKTYEGWNSPDDDEILELFDLDDEAIFETIPYEERKEGADYAVDQADFSNKLDEMERDHRYDPDDDDNAAMFEKYTEPGAVDGSYREMFVTVPELKDQMLAPTHDNDLATFKPAPSWNDGHSQYKEIQNPVVRIRFNDREADGKRILFVEEMQGPSDTNQQKMPEYLRKRIYDIGVKRVLAYAKEQGYDGVAWTTGDMQAKRYDLSKQVDEIKYAKNSDGSFDTAVYKNGSNVMNKNGISSSELESFYGKEIARQIIAGEGDSKTSKRFKYLTGDNLKVGGEGLKALYDRTLPALFKKYGKDQAGELSVPLFDKQEADRMIASGEISSYSDMSNNEQSVPFIPITASTPASYSQFSLTSPTTGLNAAELQQEFAGVPFKSKIKVVQTVEGLPGFGSTSLFSKMVEGQYKDGTVYLVAGNLPSVERARVVALGHELTHAGQNTKLVALAVQWFRDAQAKGEKGSPFQQAAMKILKEEAAKRGYNINKEADFVKAVKEATAVVAEYAYRNGERSSLLTRLLMYLKHWLRKQGIAIKFSDKELLSTVTMMMRQGEQNLTNGIGPDGGQFDAATPQFSISSPTDAARDRQLADHLQTQKFGEKTAVMVRSLFDLLESALPPKLKANMGKILNNPWWGSEGNPIRRAIVNLNLNRSHVRNALLFEIMKADGKEYEGIEGLEELLNKGSKQDKALWNKLIKQGDIDEKWYTNAELKEQGANKLVVKGYRLFHKIVDKINQVRFRELKDIALLPYKNESWFDDLKGIVDLRETLDQGLEPAQKAILTKLLKSLKDNPDLDKLAKKQPEVVAAYKQFMRQLNATSEPHLVRMAYRHINDYHTEIDKIRNEWGFVKGYAPRMRKDGDWHVSVYKIGEADGAETRTKVFMKPVNTELGATQLMKQIKHDMAGHLKSNFNESEQYVVELERDTSEPGELLSDRASNLALESLVNSALDDAGIFKTKDVDVAAIKRAIKEELAHKIMAQGFSRHGIKRDDHLIEGYRDDDYLAVLKEFGAGQSGWLSKIRYATEVTREADGIAQANPDDKVWVHNYYKDSMRNSTYLDEIAATARSVGAVYYLGFKFSSALLNGFQNYTLGQPELASMMKKAGKKGEPVLILTKAMGDVLRSNLSDEEKLVLDKAIREGTLHAQAVRAMSGLQEQGFGGKWKKFAETAMTPFSWVEQHVNREPAMLAAYRVFRDKATPAGQIDAAAFAKAEEFVNNTQVPMGNENLPELVRMLGPVGKTAYLFQGYTHHYLLWLYKRGRAGEFEAIARSFGAIALLGGAFALPGGDDLDKWIEKWFGVSYKLKAKQWINRQTKEYGWAGYKLEGFINHGLPAVFGVDMSRAIAVNLPFMSDTEKSFGERVGGVWSGLAKKPGMAASALQSGDYLRAVENLVPEFVANPMRAARQYSQGATTLAGKPIFDENGRQMKYGIDDAAKKALGFNPLDVSEQTELRGHARSLKAHWTDKRDDALAQIRKADNGKQILEIMQSFNRDLKKSQAYGPVGLITLESVHRARNVKPNKKQMQWQQAQR